jgi:cytochrome c oxidase subunit 2
MNLSSLSNSLAISFVPEQASTLAHEHDALFWVLVTLTLVFTLIVGVLILFFVIRYRETNLNVDRSNPHHHHLKLELVWSIIPALLGLAVFTWGAQVFIKMRKPPANASDVFVIGKQWMWQVQHPSGIRENNELHVPVGKPVRLTMISQDVIHSFYIPDMRAQMHVVPGRYTTLWVEATKPGKFPLFCAMHCGMQHSEMGGYVYALSPSDYEQWLASGGNRFQTPAMTMQQAGERLFQTNACGNCHGMQDSPRGPSLYGLMGRVRRMQDGSTRIADEAYVRESIINPYNNILEGYTNTMPIYGQFSEEQILQLIAYIKSLGQAPQPLSYGQGKQVSSMSKQAVGPSAQQLVSNTQNKVSSSVKL